ncbi:uncharacterized protein METZ01_LOCUS173807 [marine metagenome]|uniref:Uncharacterized protein n=1 Tax=marine metagenome TaxID=408172 RepID=A0A382C6K6_9ZZZZ
MEKLLCPNEKLGRVGIGVFFMLVVGGKASYFKTALKQPMNSWREYA